MAEEGFMEMTDEEGEQPENKQGADKRSADQGESVTDSAGAIDPAYADDSAAAAGNNVGVVPGLDEGPTGGGASQGGGTGNPS